MTGQERRNVLMALGRTVVNEVERLDASGVIMTLDAFEDTVLEATVLVGFRHGRWVVNDTVTGDADEAVSMFVEEVIWAADDMLAAGLEQEDVDSAIRQAALENAGIMV